MAESKDKPTLRSNPRLPGKALPEEDLDKLAIIQDDDIKKSVEQSVPGIKAYLKAEPIIDGS